MPFIRQAKPNDVPGVLSVCEKARRFMRAQGNMTQWVGGYPSAEILGADIERGNLYVGEDSQGRIVMAFAFIVGNDPTYAIIEDGRWLNDEPYGTIHRLASDGSLPGMFETCLRFCLGKIGNIRLDTHRDNAKMLELMERHGFRRCGVIYCQDGTPREAFQLTL